MRPFPAAVRDERAVRGVGALIKDFFGVSGTALERLVFEKLVVEVVERVGTPVGCCCLLPANMKGWRMAAWGFMRLSGSQTKHFETKSTNSSSLHRSTWARVLVPGLRLLPFELMTVRGVPLVSGDGQRMSTSGERTDRRKAFFASYEQ